MTPEDLLRHQDEATLWPGRFGHDVAIAYERALSVRTLRERRGEQPRGYKIGFTNRAIWDRYGVHAPIWGTVWNTTLSFCEGAGEVSLVHTSQPRLEPECVFGIAATPPARATLADLHACLDWVAPGFEIVQSHCPDWKFEAADTVADGALHARLLVGPRRSVRDLPADPVEFERRLAQARVRLARDGLDVEAGRGSSVLDGPLHALHHFLEALRACPGATDLQPGDVVTTGTWTDAWPVRPGESWRADFDAPLVPLTIRFTA